MLVPILIFAGCFSLGTAAAGRWLPDLGTGRIADIALFAVCGLLGAALALVGLHIYSVVTSIGSIGGRVTKGELLAAGLERMLIEAGTLAGLAAIAYLLAPQGRRERIAAAARASTLPETD